MARPFDTGLRLLVALVAAGVLWFLLTAGDDDVAPGGDGSTLIERDTSVSPSLRTEGQTPPALSAPQAPPPPATADGASALALSGRVVDERRRPVPGTAVALRLGVRVLQRATTDAAGRYTLDLALGAGVAGARALVLATASDGRRGSAAVYLTARGGAAQALPIVVVRAAAALAVHVVRNGADVLGADVAIVWREAGVALSLASRHADEHGRAAFLLPPVGQVEVYATAVGYGRGMTRVRVPRLADAGPVEVALGAERILEVDVRDGATDRPLAGAEVFVGDRMTMPAPHGPGYQPALPRARSDRRGHVTIRRLGRDETLYVNVSAPGYALAPWWRSQTQTLPAGRDALRVALLRRRLVRFPIVEDDVPAPPEGAVVRVDIRGAGRAQDAALSARIEGAFVVLRGVGNDVSAGTFTAPDGSQASFRLPAANARRIEQEGPTVTFRRARVVRVRVTEPDGTPVAGLGLRLAPLGVGAVVAPGLTDVEGLATFQGVGGDRATLHARLSDRPWGGPLLGNLDLTDGSEMYEIVLQPGVEVRLTLLLAGEPGLPATYSIRLGGQRLDPALVTEDPASGTLAFPVRPPAEGVSTRLDLRADGFLPEAITIEPGAQGSVERSVTLRPASTLLVHVRPPEDGAYQLQLQRDDGETGVWRSAPLPGTTLGGPGSVRPTEREGTDHVFQGLAPGHYRMFDLRSRVAGEPLDVAAGAARIETIFDLSAAVWVRGRVLAPAGAKLVQARVLVSGRDDPGSVWSGTRPAADGAFRVRAATGQRLTLRVTHPTLTAAAEGGTASVVAGRGDVTLRLEAGGELRFRVAGYDDAQTPDGGLWQSPLQVHLDSEKPGGAGALAIQPVAEGGAFRAGGFAPGTYTLRIVFGRLYAPYERRGLALGRGIVDLGLITPSRGTTLRVRVAGLAQKPGISLWAVVSHEGQPAYARHGRLDREAGEIVCGGLGPGRFRVVVRGAGLAPGAPATRILLEKVVTLDGASEAHLDLRLP